MEKQKRFSMFWSSLVIHMNKPSCCSSAIFSNFFFTRFRFNPHVQDTHLKISIKMVSFLKLYSNLRDDFNQNGSQNRVSHRWHFDRTGSVFSTNFSAVNIQCVFSAWYVLQYKLTTREPTALDNYLTIILKKLIRVAWTSFYNENNNNNNINYNNSNLKIMTTRFKVRKRIYIYYKKK